MSASAKNDPIWLRAFRARLRLLDRPRFTSVHFADGGRNAAASQLADAVQRSVYASRTAELAARHLKEASAHARVAVSGEVRVGIAACYARMLPLQRDLIDPDLAEVGMLPPVDSVPSVVLDGRSRVAAEIFSAEISGRRGEERHVTGRPLWLAAFRARQQTLAILLQNKTEGGVLIARHYATNAAFAVIPSLESQTGHDRIRLHAELKAGLMAFHAVIAPEDQLLLAAEFQKAGLDATGLLPSHLPRTEEETR